MIETINDSPEFEQKPYKEIERKFLPLFPEQLAAFREAAVPIEQYYLSHPSEPFSLRFRETADDGICTYRATLKDRGITTTDGLERLEVEVPISAELYEYYKTQSAPQLRKLRYYANNHVCVDFFEDGHIQIESEHPIAWQQFVDSHGDNFSEVTGDRITDNEWRAHTTYRKRHDGSETLIPGEELDIDSITREIHEQHRRLASPVMVQIAGRSGSGKSTIVRALREKLQSIGLDSIVLSTDDYHRGISWLTAYNNGSEWREWDHPIVYDTTEMAADLRKLQRGQAIPKREINFKSVEPTYDGIVTPSPVVLIEGIYAGCADLEEFRTLQYQIPTPFATCVGRRLLRDIRERPQFGDIADNLRYILEQAEPRYREV